MTNTAAVSRTKGEASFARGPGQRSMVKVKRDSRAVSVGAAALWRGRAGSCCLWLMVYGITFFGVPNTWQILKMVSISLAPGKRGRRVYTSAMMQPTAQTSMGEL